MGTTPKPLVIVVLPPVDTWPEVAALAAQKHQVYTLAGFMEQPTLTIDQVDVWLGPTCWRMDEQHRKYLPIAIAEARRARYPSGKGKTK